MKKFNVLLNSFSQSTKISLWPGFAGSYPCICLAILLTVTLFGCSSGQPAAQKSPYPPSPLVQNITWDFENLVRKAFGSDLWPMTWAADDNLYSSWGDGVGFGAVNFQEQWGQNRADLGFSRIAGNPLEFRAANIWGGKNAEHPATFKGKSAGIVSVDGILYAWINLQDSKTPEFRLAWSADLGANWELSFWKFSSSEFAPSTILNFGKDYSGARDTFVYCYGGKWGYTESVDLVRVHKDRIKDRTAYEFYAGMDANGAPAWISESSRRRPVFVDPNLHNEFNGSLKASVIHNPALNRYILTIPHGGVGKLGIFDAPEPWGPWTTVAYYDDWGSFENSFRLIYSFFGRRGEALIYSFPTKWISADGKTMWLVFSAYDPPGRVLDSFNLVKATLTFR
jgi:Domain of unknown function (DUF4185)